MEERPSPPREARSSQNRGSPRGTAPAVAAVRMEPLLVWVVQRTEDFPRKHKFSMGERWVEACLDVLTGLVEAQYARDKRALLATASRGLVRMLARVAGTNPTPTPLPSRNERPTRPGGRHP